LWVGTQDGGVSVFQVSNGNVIKSVDNISDHARLQKMNVHAFAEDKNGNLWIGSSSGLVLFKRNENKFFLFDAPNYAVNGLNIMSLYVDSDENLWIGSQGAGLFQLDLRQFNTRPLNDFIFLRIRNLNDFDISKRTVQSIYQDKDKNLWVGTFGDGLYFVSNAKQNFIKIQKPLYDNTAVSFVPYYGMCYDKDGALWLGTDGNGIFKSDINGNTIAHFTSESTKRQLKDNAILSALRDHSSNLWFGSYAHGIFKYLPTQNSFENYRYEGETEAGNGGHDVRVMFEDSKNNIWVGTNRGGLCILDPVTKSYSNPGHFEGAFKDGDIRAITEDPQGNLWVGFYGDGVYRYSPDSKVSKRYFNESDQLLKSDIVFAIKSDRSGRIWVGTGGGGLCMYDQQSDQVHRFTEKDGLANNTVYSLVIDNKENIWMTTNSGISKFDLNKRRFQNFDVSDGLQEGQFNPGSSMYNEVSGFICVGGSYGLNMFYPDQVSSQVSESEILLSGLSLFNKPVHVNDSTDGEPVLKEVISRTKEISLAYDQNVITFDFVGLNYTFPEKNTYAYKLDGLDDDWNYVGSQRSATYRYLNPGHYNFKVKVSSTDDNWNNDYASIRVVINPPIWKTYYAYAFYFVCVTGLTLLLLFFRRKQLGLRRRLKIEKSQRKHERELVRQKLSFFTEISHEFKTPLTLMIGPLEEMLASETSVTPIGRKLKMVYRNAHKLLNLINKLLDYRKIESGNVMLRIKEENVVEFVKEIYITFKELANHKNIELRFHADLDDIRLWFDKEKLEMILNNIISNSFKYIGKGNEISISICKQISDKHPNGRAVIKIRDNGIGIPKKHLGNVFDWFHRGETSGTMSSGIGLALAKRLVHLHKGEIFVESAEGSGSVFSIKIPLGKEHFKPEEFITETEEKTISVETASPDHEKFLHDDAEHAHKKGMNSLLLIEDDPEIRDFLREYFEKDYKILETENGRLGLEVATQSHPDLIISDIMVPEMDGIDFCRELKNNIKTSHIPVILLTAKASLTHHKEGIQTGADAYITKPFSPDILRMTVHNLLQSRENLKRFYRNLFAHETATPESKEKNTIDEKFLQSIYEQLMANLDKPDFNINELCDVLHMSRSLVYKKVKSLTGLSPVEYIRTLRMHEAAKLLRSKQYKVFEVVYMVGFTDLKYFRQCFAKEFGHSPSDFIKTMEEPQNSPVPPL
jgi:signal transduction histidine kinase/DNA-binding response OmpR family regulator/streptogramin lyase